MPFEEGLRLHDHQSVAPVEELRERNHRETKRRRCPPWPHLPLVEQGKLFSEEPILGDQGNTGGKEQPKDRQQLDILQ
jgi:hypothetical protein